MPSTSYYTLCTMYYVLSALYYIHMRSAVYYILYTMCDVRYATNMRHSTLYHMLHSASYILCKIRYTLHTRQYVIRYMLYLLYHMPCTRCGTRNTKYGIYDVLYTICALYTVPWVLYTVVYIC